MMTIVYISSEYPPLTGTGGIGTYTKHIAEGMSLRGHAVHVISRSPSTQYYEQTIKGVTIHRIPPDPFFLPQGWYLYYIRMILRWFFYNTLVRLSWASAAARELQRLKQSIGNIDIVEYPECGAEGFFVRKTAGSAVIVRLHTPWYIVRKINTIRECPGDHLLFRFLERHTIAKADCITVPTRAVVSLLKLSGNRNSVRVLPNPVAPTVKPQHTDRRLWIYTGRVERRKGVDLLIDAYFNVCQTHEPPDLLLVGAPYGIDRDGISYENKIEQRIADSPHSKKIRWIKGVAHESVQEYLYQSSTAFFPSLWENLSYACIEAMAAGCTAVVSDCGGFPELITNRVNGILVKTGDVAQWTSVMIDILTNEQQFSRLGTAAAEHINRHYSCETVCLKTEEIYLDCIRKSDVKR